MTPRRWLKLCNPELAAFLDKHTKSGDWILNQEELKKFVKLADDPKIL